MSYAFLTIKSEQDGQEVVRRSRRTDVIGYTLRGVYDDTSGMPDDMALMLRQLDAIPHRIN